MPARLALKLSVLCVYAFVALMMGLNSTRVSAVGDPKLLDNLVRPALISAPAISSDGHYLSGLYRQDDDTSLTTVWHIDSGFKAGETLPYKRSDIHWMSWVGGGRLLLSLKENGLVLYDAHLKRLRPLIDKGGPRPGQLPPFLLSPLHSDPTSILLQWEDETTTGFPAVYKVNAVTGTSQKIISAWAPIVRWWASPEGAVTLGEGFDGRKQKLFGRRSDGAWHPISKRDFFTGPAYSVLSVETGGATALVLAAHRSNTRALWRMHTATGQMIRKLAGHDRYDMGAVLVDPLSDIAIGASYEGQKPEAIIWSPAEKASLANMAKRLGVKRVELASSSRDGRRKLYRVRSSQRPVRYHLYDRESDTLIPLPDTPEYQKLPQRMVQTVYIPIRGMKRDMPAVLSHPEAGPTGKAVVLVHGGPVRRASENYSRTVSWLTANGYSVLQPNFRGSSGFGEKWRRAGYAEWGRAMQRDVRTAATWLVRNGISTKGSMCVMGGSYGGYSALMSAIMDDDLFRCAVSLNGVTSIPHLVAYLDTKRFRLLTIPRIVGRLSARTLRRRSPLYRVDLVRMPVLMLHATRDANVPFQHGVMMARALKEHGKPHEFIVLKGAEHVLKHAQDRRIYLQKSLDFIETYLGDNSKHPR